MNLVHIGPTVEEWEPPRTRYEMHTNFVHAVVVLPDNERAVSAGEDGRMFLFEIDSGEVVRQVEGHAGPANDLRIHGHFLASAGDDRTVRIWDLRADLEPKYVLEGHDNYVRQVALSDEHIVSVSTDSTVRIWTLEDGKLRHEFDDHKESIQSVAISPNGRFAVSASLEQAVLVWDLKAGKRVDPLYDAQIWVHQMGFGGLHMAGKNTTGVGHYAQTPKHLHFLTDDRLVSASDGVILWDFPNRKELARVDNLAWSVESAAFDSARAFVGTHTEIRGMTHDLADIVFRCPAPDGGATALCLHGDRLIAGGKKGDIHVIDVAGWMPEQRHISDAREATAAPGEACVATIDSDAVVRLWDFERGETLGTFDRYSQPNSKPFAFSADGKVLATTGDPPPAVCLWDLESNELIAEINHEYEEGRDYGVHSLTFVGDELLVGPAAENTIQLWNADGKTTTPFVDATCQISDLKVVGDTVLSIGYFQPEGGTDDGSGYVSSVSHLQGWDLNTRKLLWTRAGQKPEGAKWATHFHTLIALDDGRVLTETGEKNGSLCVIDPASGEILRRWELPAYASPIDVDGNEVVARVSSSDDERAELVWFELDGGVTKSIDIPYKGRYTTFARKADRMAWAEDHDVVLLELSTGKELARTTLDQKPTTLLLRSDGERLFVGMDTGRVRMYAVDED